ncbi:hypothetical protein CVS30_06085 [Arthrobacter psychrolactophilus]|uniref:ArsR family transcriptional regulator n=1 Tax=Arthrobacter psychrolactophilus TaxID=92442 RepID=A0A2V5IVQ0_9MICC|nr:hypothetical protein [Arthrobacter psychrolactophilus]PYI39512.1 hypothetical protein CVS30_06085 [Arthrobacter psychrolactophilus]
MSRLLFTPANTRLLRLLNSGCPLDVPSISRTLAVQPRLVRRQLWELQRLRLVCRSLPATLPGPNRFTVDIRQLQDALAVAAQEMGTADE